MKKVKGYIALLKVKRAIKKNKIAKNHRALLRAIKKAGLTI